jgi:hypothetical protein
MVGFGSWAAYPFDCADGSFIPINRHHSGKLAWPIGATFGLMHRSKAASAR